MVGETLRISNMSKSHLQELWRRSDSEELNKLLLSSSSKEVTTFFSRIPENGTRSVLDGLDEVTAEFVLRVMNPSRLNSVLLLASTSFLKRLPTLITKSLLCDILSRISPDTRNQILQSVPVKDRMIIQEKISARTVESKMLDEIMSDEHSTLLERDAMARFKEIRERERFLEQRQRAREEQMLEHFESLRHQIVEAEKEVSSRQARIKGLEASYAKRESELKENIRLLQEEHQKQVQERIEVKVPAFVKSALEALEDKEESFATKARIWNWQGHVAVILAIIAAIVGFWYGADVFKDASKENINWFFFCFVLLKGLVIISLFAAWAKHSYTVASAYVHESLKRSDRMHAINFGKLYLEVYGNDVSQMDMKAVFENWNLDSDSAFTRVKTADLQPKVLEQLTKFVDSVSRGSQAKNDSVK
ncbi:hypothetical protein [Pseudomonas putida]|uniref:hypothetical protein n=1 Tax=Pseudomonas putida TaxID=303 RepID=UPI00126025BC|nr:hypothetical protein [Pseudomonas putida]